jgi:hypothetical protein
VLLADGEVNDVLSMKRVNIKATANSTLKFISPDDPGDYKFTVHLMCGSYLGLDVEQEFSFTVE